MGKNGGDGAGLSSDPYQLGRSLERKEMMFAAIGTYRAGSHRGCPRCSMALARILERGRWGHDDAKPAAWYLERAARQGNRRARGLFVDRLLKGGK